MTRLAHPSSAAEGQPSSQSTGLPDSSSQQEAEDAVGQSHQLLIDEVMADNLLLQREPPYRTVTQRIQAWRDLTEDKNVLQAIAHGIDIPISKAP